MQAYRRPEGELLAHETHVLTSTATSGTNS